jgi:hypothetical protein
MFCSGRPATKAKSVRCACGACEVSQTVNFVVAGLIRARLRLFCGKLRRLTDLPLIDYFADQDSFRPDGFDRCRADIGTSNPCSATNSASIQGHLGGDAHSGKVAYFPFQFKVNASTARGWNRNPDFGQNFAVFQSGGENGEKKTGDRYRSLAALPGGDDFRAQRQHGGRVIVGRISMRQISADRRQVADLGIGNHRGGIEDDRILRADQAGGLQIRLACKAADFQKATLFFDVLKVRVG